MAELPFFPMAIDAYLADTRHLSDAEHGRYHLILYELWRAPNRRLPNDDEWLARKFCRSVEQVKSELRPLISEFCKCDGNWITQKRLTKEFERAKRVTRQRSDAAKSLWKKKKSTSERICEETQPRIVPADEPTPTLRPTPTPTPTYLHSLSDAWQPSKEDVIWANNSRPDLSAEQLKAETERFRYHAQANGRTAIHWGPNWRNWISRAKPAEPQKASPSQSNGFRPVEEPWEQRLRHYKPNDPYSWKTHDWGPPPDYPGCRVPAAILAAWRPS